VAELALTVTVFESPERWRLVLTSQGGRVLTDHAVRLDAHDWRREAFGDLDGYLRVHAAPDPRLRREAEIVAEVSAWAGREVLGQVGAALHEAARAGPVTARVVVPDEPPAARQVAYVPLELADAAGKLALQGATQPGRLRRDRHSREVRW
jgi:hypothetical protein